MSYIVHIAYTVFLVYTGHFGSSDYDYIRTSNATRLMMEELLNDPEAGAKGFVSDTVAIFPLKNGGAHIDHSTGERPLHPLYKPVQYGYQFREVNLSAWTSEKAAHEV